jgi:hypothetical protein
VLIHFDIYASDPDGDEFQPSISDFPPGALLGTPEYAHWLFDWIPTAAQVGVWHPSFGAQELSDYLPGGWATTVITVVAGTEPPVLTAPAAVSTSEGATLAFTVSAADPGGGHVDLTASGLPLGAAFADHGDNTGTFTWVPAYTQAGDYKVQFQAVDTDGLIATATTAIHVDNTNRAPVAIAGGPYFGTQGVPVALDGSQSSDPDGDAITFSWEFSDGFFGAGAKVSHTYVVGGRFVAHLTVGDPAGLAGCDSAIVNVGSVCAALVFTTGGDDIIRLSSRKPTWCAQFQPRPGCFEIELIDLSSFKMFRTDVLGPSIPAIQGKTVVKSDRNGDGVPEITVCFAKEDLRALFAALPAGEGVVAVRIEAVADVWGRVVGDYNVRVSKTGGALAASIAPNPLRTTGQLQFVTSRPGALRVRLFDVHGRLVRTLLDEQQRPAGYHDVRIDGLSDAGSRLTSGVYFYRIEAPEGVETGRLAIMN